MARLNSPRKSQGHYHIAVVQTPRFDFPQVYIETSYLESPNTSASINVCDGQSDGLHFSALRLGPMHGLGSAVWQERLNARSFLYVLQWAPAFHGGGLSYIIIGDCASIRLSSLSVSLVYYLLQVIFIAC